MPIPFDGHLWMAIPAVVVVVVVFVPYACFLAWDVFGRLNKVSLWKGELTFHPRNSKSQGRASKSHKTK